MVKATLALLDKVLKAQLTNQETAIFKSKMEAGSNTSKWSVHADESLRYVDQVFVPNMEGLWEKVLKEFHHSAFAVHPRGNKM